MTASPPLTPADCDLRDFQFMPLDVVRLRDSDLAALESPEACWAAVQLWGASWHQIPAGSLPDDDRVLAQLAGYGRVVKEWLRVKPGALRHFVKCADGRLYHPVVSEKAREAWDGKLRRLWMTECARVKKHNQRTGEELSAPSLETFLASRRPGVVPRDKPDASPKTDNGVPEDAPPVSPDCPSGNTIQGTGKGTGKGILSSEANASAGSDLIADPDKLAWSSVRLLLGDRCEASGETAGRFFGKLLSDNGLAARDMLPAITSAAVNATGDPKSYLTQAAKGIAKRKGEPRLSPSQLAARSNIQ